VKFYWQTVSGRPRLIIVLNVVKIGRLSPPSWIFEIAKFYWLLWQRGSRHMSLPNFVNFGQSVVKILRFFRFFQDGGRRHLGLSNSQNFIG